MDRKESGKSSCLHGSKNSNCFQAFLKAGVRLIPMLPMNHWILGFRRVPKIAVGVQSTQKFVFFFRFEIKLDFNMIYQSLCAPE